MISSRRRRSTWRPGRIGRCRRRSRRCSILCGKTSSEQSILACRAGMLTVEFPMRPWWFSLLAVLGLLTAAIPAHAQERAYSYSVVHPLYGTIGTFTESIARNGDTQPADDPRGVAVRI